MSDPTISVIMPVYNATAFLEESINSILNQTFQNFEFLIFNDGSTDSSLEIIQSFKDSRIRLFNSRNLGYLQHLNQGLKISIGKYIARMDADDISHPDRFQHQFEFLERNPLYGLCGSFIEFKSQFKNLITWVTAVDHEEIAVTLLYQNTICHPSVMMRKSIFSDNNLCYRKEYYLAEDYKLWIELSKYTRLYNIPEPLLQYRIHQAQVSTSKKSLQGKIRDKVIFDQLIDLNINPSEGVPLLMDLLSDYNQKAITTSSLIRLTRLINMIKKQNISKKIYNSNILNLVLSRQLEKQPKSRVASLLSSLL